MRTECSIPKVANHCPVQMHHDLLTPTLNELTNNDKCIKCFLFYPVYVQLHFQGTVNLDSKVPLLGNAPQDLTIKYNSKWEFLKGSELEFVVLY
eukprot:g28052.t1